MSQARLYHIIILHVLRDRTDILDNKDVAKELCKRNERHKNYLGQFYTLNTKIWGTSISH